MKSEKKVRKNLHSNSLPNNFKIMTAMCETCFRCWFYVVITKLNKSFDKNHANAAPCISRNNKIFNLNVPNQRLDWNNLFADSRALHNTKSAITRKHGKITHKRRQDSTTNKYCSCSTKICNCCREFNIPVVSLQGPGCASLQYLKGDRLAISMSFGERVLTNTTISSKTFYSYISNSTPLSS